MKLIGVVLSFICIGILNASETQVDYFGKQRNDWLQKAESLKPELTHKTVRPKFIVEPQKDSSAFQGIKFVKSGQKIEDLYKTDFRKIKTITLDFGDHYTGYFTFRTKLFNTPADAPLRIKFFFGELPAELNTPLDPWKGALSRAWMQDETITLTEIGKSFTIPRRVSFRYLKIELLGYSGFDFAIDDMFVVAQTSASNTPDTLPKSASKEIADIYRVALKTLSECMQTVYEDGPKRDKRLWLGDLYLESLANAKTFKNFNLTKRCLYLFAATSGENGFVYPCCFEEPFPHPQKSNCISYSLLFNSTLLEYLKDTNDYETARDLWLVAKRQMELSLEYVNKDAMHDTQKRAWRFFDWRNGLDTTACMQAATIFALSQTRQLAEILGESGENWEKMERQMKEASLKNLFDKKRNVFVCPNGQVSILSQVWFTIANVGTRQMQQTAIKNALADERSVKIGTPYATHYLIEAMIACGMKKEAKEYLINYWGSMIKKGADTFWEAYDPNNDFLSPYGFFPVNSACHAWSCTPAYFIKKHPEIFIDNSN